MVESADIKKADLNKLTQKIQEEFLKIQKQLAKLAKDKFDESSLAGAKIKELESKLKYHKISQVEIIERQINNQTIVYQVRGELIEKSGVNYKSSKLCREIYFSN